MIVDVHSHCLQPDHISAPGQRALEAVGYAPMQPYSLDDYLEAMEPVDHAILFGVRAVANGHISPNKMIADWVRRAPEKLIGFMAIDPMEGDYLDQIDRGVGEQGLRGIKIYPTLAHFDPADPNVFALYEKAQRLGLPILSHVGAQPNPRAILAYSQPISFDTVAMAFPELKIIIAHLAHPWQRDCAVVVRKNPNVFADISGVWHRPWHGWEAMMTMVEWGVTDKLFFGSDYPLWTPQEGMDGIRRFNEQVEGTSLPRIPEEVIEGIFQRNALELLGLD